MVRFERRLALAKPSVNAGLQLRPQANPGGLGGLLGSNGSSLIQENQSSRIAAKYGSSCHLFRVAHTGVRQQLITLTPSVFDGIISGA